MVALTRLLLLSTGDAVAQEYYEQDRPIKGNSRTSWYLKMVKAAKNSPPRVQLSIRRALEWSMDDGTEATTKTTMSVLTYEVTTAVTPR